GRHQGEEYTSGYERHRHRPRFRQGCAVKSRLLLGLGIALLPVGFGVVLAVPSWRAEFLGRLRGEPFMQGRPLSSWVGCLREGDAVTRRQAAAALGCLKGRASDAVPALRDALRDPDGETRREAAYALGRIGPAAKDAVPELVEALKDNSPVLRRVAAIALY